ncbi:MAG: YggS family pyridoxal phosphate enzyme [Betaproteobacteria bacterium TMED82]|nr:MAG: YggS family pyridoxal phosphate enzyme [Betaproteobacteria bacterium TMED82]|tara:strand:+ start:67895 stop:68608 length:714 start_codon:yes stop_codon:yes gene_type:complete
MESKLNKIRDSIRKNCKLFDKEYSAIYILAVSKTFPPEKIEEALSLGIVNFGENYVSEAINKIQFLSKKKDMRELNWHFIGPIQGNKTKLISEHFDWVHSVESEKHARRLSEQRPISKGKLNICVQINLSQEKSKSGISPEETENFFQVLKKYQNLKLRGLMTIPEKTNNKDLTHYRYQTLKQIKRNINSTVMKDSPLDTLSMGMSNDFEIAVSEADETGITLLRIGSAIFGERTKI